MGRDTRGRACQRVGTSVSGSVEVPAIRAVPGPAVEDRGSPRAACHAGGRGFESRRSRKSTCKSASFVARAGANDRRLLSIPRRSRTRIDLRLPQEAGQRRRSPQAGEPAEVTGGRSRTGMTYEGLVGGTSRVTKEEHRHHPGDGPRNRTDSVPHRSRSVCRHGQRIVPR